MSRQDWRTPPSVFACLNERFGPFDCDVAADALNALCDNAILESAGPPTPHEWGQRNWCNPPFGDCALFVKTASTALESSGKHTVMLTHANPNSPWFQSAIKYAALHCPDRRINYWHPDEQPKKPGSHGGAARDSVIWHFGGEPGRVFTIEIPEHRQEVARLTSECSGQLTLAQTGGLF